MLERVLKSELDEARLYLLVNVIETYFPLSGSALAQFRQVVARKEYASVLDEDLTWGDNLILKGEEAGVIKGIRETLKRLLTAKFGTLPVELDSRIDAVGSGQELDAYLERVLTASALEEMGLESG